MNIHEQQNSNNNRGANVHTAYACDVKGLQHWLTL